MATWRAYIDDSASEGAVLNYDFSPKAIQKMNGEREVDGAITRAMTAGIVAVKGSNLHALVNELTALRREIKSRFKLDGDGLPKFHMRHLWGSQANYDKGRNPFYSLSMKQRFQIARFGYEFLMNASQRHGLVVAANGMITANVQKEWAKFYSDERTIIEKNIIFSRFRSRKQAKQFYNRVLNPASGLVADLMHQFDGLCQIKNGLGIIKYDTSDASKGFDADELYDVLLKSGLIEKVSQSSHGIAIDECLLQLADMVSFKEFRHGLDISRGNKKLVDPYFLRLIDGIDILNFPPAKEKFGVQSIPTHFLTARQFLEKIDGDWVQQNMRTVEDLYQDMKMGLAESQGGLYILRDETVLNFKKNGQVP